MSELRPWAIIGGATFAVLVAGSWWSSRALEFPEPESALLRATPPTVERFLNQRIFRPQAVRLRMYESVHDSPLAREADKVALKSDGPDPSGERSPRGWSVGSIPATGVEGRTVLIYVTSWRPRTRIDAALKWRKYT